MNSTYIYSVIVVVALMTMLIRFLPFIVFKNNVPKIVEYLGGVLPYSIMAMLVVYCLRNIDILGQSHGLPEIIASLFVVLIHKFKHNLLLSVVCGTVVYMFLINII